MVHEEPLNSVRAAIEAYRTDILKSVLDAAKKALGEEEFKVFINQPIEQYGTFLHWVTEIGQADMVRVLLSCGADPCTVDLNGDKPFSKAIDDHTKSAYVNALFASIAQQDLNMTEKLISAGLDVDIRDNDEKMNTPLHWAVSFGNKDAIRCLVEHGSNLDLTNSSGLTPFHEAVQLCNLGVIQLLVKLGVDVNYPVQGTSELKGKTVFDIAKPGTPVKSYLARFQRRDTVPPAEVNGHHHHVQRTASRSAAPVSPGSESLISMDEVNTSLPYIRLPARSVVTDTRLHWIWPQPKQIEQFVGKPFVLDHSWNISLVGCSLPVHQVLDVWDIHKPLLTSLGIDANIGNIGSNDISSNKIICCVKSTLFSTPESYRVTVASDKISIICSDKHGLHYALATLEQLISLYKHDGEIQPVHIADSPSIRFRSILVDITSNGRVPLLDTLFSFIEIWRFLKLNQVHLYNRICQASFMSETQCWPYSKSELLSLDRYCLDRGIELVPALDVHGSNFEKNRLQAVINSTKACFPSTNFFHAGPQLTSLLLESCNGDMESAMISDVTSNVTWLLCANTIRDKNIPFGFQPNCLFVEYGFQADYNFHNKTEVAWQESAALCFCGGTASWDCLMGYPDAAAANIFHAVQAAVDRGSLCSIAATWTDSVPLSSLQFAWPGWLLQTGLAWNHTVHWDFIQNSLGDLISLWVFGESIDSRLSLGKVIIEMGRLETWLVRQARGDLDRENTLESCTLPPALPPNGGSVHYQLLLDPDNVNVDHLSVEHVVRVIRHAKKWHKELIGVTNQGIYSSTGSIALSQALLSADFMLLACRIGRGILQSGTNPNSNMGVSVINVGIANLAPTLRTDAANRLLSLIERFQELWLQQYQSSNGLHSTTAALQTAIQRLLAHVGSPDI